MAIIKISITGIKAIHVNYLPFICGLMQLGIFENPDIFTGKPPNTFDEISKFISTYTAYHTAFTMGGINQKHDYEVAKTAIRDCMLNFAPYIDKIAKGDKSILALSSLPTTGNFNNSTGFILEGRVPKNVKGTPGNTGVIKTTCTVFGQRAFYFAILVADNPLEEGITTTPDGQLILPPSGVNYYLNSNGKRNKTFANIPTNRFYWLYYVVISGGYVSGYSEGKRVSAGA